MNNIEKAGIILAGILVIAAIAYYSIPGIKGSSAFMIIEPGIIPSISLGDVCNVYVSSETGDNNNDGLTKQTPVRTIRKSVEIANECGKYVSVKFLDGLYEMHNEDGASSWFGNINITNPISLSFGPDENIDDVLVKYVGAGVPLISLVVYPPENINVENITFKDINTLDTAVQIHGENSKISVTGCDFELSPHTGRPFGLTITTEKSASIVGNTFKQNKPLVGYLGYDFLFAGLRIDERKGWPEEVVVTENMFILPADYYEEYDADGFGSLTQTAGIVARTGSVNIFGNTFITEGFNGPGDFWSSPSMRTENLHNVGVITGLKTQEVTIVNNNFKDFDGLDVVSMALVQKSYNDENKQDVVIRDNFISK